MSLKPVQVGEAPEDVLHGPAQLREAAGVVDATLHTDNVRSALELGLLAGCDQWALGAAVGRVLCQRREER